MLSHHVIVAGLSALAVACQATGDAGGSAPIAAKPEIVVHDPSAAVVARITLAEPCRATIDGVDLIVGVAPLVAQVGATRWTGESATNGTVMKRDGQAIARLYAASKDELALFDPQGIALVRATRGTDGVVAIADRQSTVVRRATGTGGKVIEIAGVGPTLHVAGTDDALLAAILTAPEATPEVRALAACHQLFPETKAL